MGGCSVMVLRLVLHGAATKPGASCGARHKVVLLGTRRYQGLLVMIHYGATPMCYLLVNLFPWMSFPILSEDQCLNPRKFPSVGDWNLDSWI
jgi:hypothetical protein